MNAPESRAPLWLVVTLLGGVTLIIALAVAAIAVDTVFSVIAHTERVEVVTTNGPTSRWHVPCATLRASRGDSSCVSGFVDVDSQVIVTFTRIAHGHLTMSMESADGTRSIGSLLDETEERSQALPARAEFEIADIPKLVAEGRTLLFPVTGRVSLGSPTTYRTAFSAPVLRSGHVRMLEKELLGSQVFAVGETALEAGDSFRVDDASSIASGILVVNDAPAMTAAFSIRGRSGMLLNPGKTQQPIRASALLRIQKDPSFQLFWLLLAATMAGLIKRVREELQSKLRRVFSRRPGRRSPSHDESVNHDQRHEDFSIAATRDSSSR